MKQLARYIFVFLILILVYLVYLVLSYKYTEYRVMQYMENITATNKKMIQQIEDTKQLLEYKNTRAYKNKILKADKGMKNKGEEVIFLITEQQYNKYTSSDVQNQDQEFIPQDVLNEESLISTMNIFEKWIYLIFNKDIR